MATFWLTRHSKKFAHVRRFEATIPLGVTDSEGMWYAASMFNAENLIGKPLVVYIDGERRQIGTIEKAAVRSGNLYVGAVLDLADVIEVPEGVIFKETHDES